MSKVECYERLKIGHYARDFRSKEKAGGGQPRGEKVSKKRHRGRRGAVNDMNAQASNEDRKGEGPISLSRAPTSWKAPFDEHQSWARLMVGTELVEPWADIKDDGQELEAISWQDEKASEANPWVDTAMFIEVSILIADEPVDPTWVVDRSATHHITARGELLRDVRKLQESKVFGLADKTASMKTSEIGEVRCDFDSGRWPLRSTTPLVCGR